MRQYLALIAAGAGLISACGSSSPAAQPPAASAQQPPHEDPERTERARRKRLAEAHHKLEEEQQEALALTCRDATATQRHDRCLPSCYRTEPPDPRKGQRPTGLVELGHLVCETDEPGKYVVQDGLATGGTLVARTVRGRAPARHKAGSWQGALGRALVERWVPKLARGDTLVVTGAWRTVSHPLTGAKLRCVPVSQRTRVRRPLDACGGTGNLGCEAGGSPVARAINVVHYRLAEAERLAAAGRSGECQTAALEAVAVARGLPRWRQYVQLNIAKWKSYAAYRTRYDGVLDEDALFAATAAFGAEAARVHAGCGGASAKTTAAQEQSFHACW